MSHAPVRRRCPGCRAVVLGTDLPLAGRVIGVWGAAGGNLRRCPHCQFTGRTWQFRAIEERQPRLGKKGRSVLSGVEDTAHG